MDAVLTPVENRKGLWYKREDLYRGAFGVNGAKYRACQHLISKAAAEGNHTVVSGASVLSPQSAMAAVVAQEFGLKCRVIVGGTTPEKSLRHKSIQIATEAGATVEAIAVGYNPALQKAALAAAEEPGVWRLPYGITTSPEASQNAVEDFLRVGAAQTMNLPDEVETLVLPFGSGNTAAGVLYGLQDFAPESLRKVVLIGIGPNRLRWLQERLALAGRPLVSPSILMPSIELELIQLHPAYAEYGDAMRETLDGIVLHPTYEGKVVRFLNFTSPGWWKRRDGRTALWIVGGPIS